MEQVADATVCRAVTRDPQPDRGGDSVPARTMPARIAALLHTVRVMLGFGRHLAETAPQRAASADFNVIAAGFGTGRLSAIMARLQRGILLATALQNLLLARAARGQDIDFAAPRQHAAVPLAAPQDPPADPPGPPAGQPAVAPVVRRAPRMRLRPRGWDDPEQYMPTLEELEAQVRRRPLGQILVAICLDLAVLPGFCAGAFWNRLSEDIRLYGGSVSALMQEKLRREDAFGREQARRPFSNLDWRGLTREAVRVILGRFIGEAPGGVFDT